MSLWLGQVAFLSFSSLSLCPEALIVGSQPSLSPGPRAGNFTCLTNNLLRIDCRWSVPELGQGSSPGLLFTSNRAPDGTRKCISWVSECTVVLPPEAVLLPSNNFIITFHHCVSGREQVSLVELQYLPWRHVKLDPLSDLQSNVSSGHCILTWSISPALELMTTLLSYELGFKRQEEAWEEMSTWSPLIPPWGWPGSTFVAVSVFLLLTGLTYLLFKPSPRVKRTFYQNMSSPVAFFRPLYSVHNGNFQTWMGAHRAGMLLSWDCAAGTPRGASEPCVQEATALLTCGPSGPWKSVVLEEEQEGTGPASWGT
ncbi:hypothetical protein H8959_017967 [Pygathrix nigripes]